MPSSVSRTGLGQITITPPHLDRICLETRGKLRKIRRSLEVEAKPCDDVLTMSISAAFSKFDGACVQKAIPPAGHRFADMEAKNGFYSSPSITRARCFLCCVSDGLLLVVEVEKIVRDAESISLCQVAIVLHASSRLNDILCHDANAAKPGTYSRLRHVQHASAMRSKQCRQYPLDLSYDLVSLTGPHWRRDGDHAHRHLSGNRFKVCSPPAPLALPSLEAKTL